MTTTTSKQFTINISDVLKGLLMSVLTPVITIIITSLNAGELTFDWKKIAITALGAGLAYVVKNFFTPAEIVIKNPTNAQVNSVQEGNAIAKVITK